MRLIDVDELVSKIDELSKDAGFYRPIYENFLKVIKGQPTIDAVPVVRCNDCKCYDEPEGDGWCYEHDRVVSPDDFCSYGERKDGDT